MVSFQGKIGIDFSFSSRLEVLALLSASLKNSMSRSLLPKYIPGVGLSSLFLIIWKFSSPSQLVSKGPWREPGISGGNLSHLS